MQLALSCARLAQKRENINPESRVRRSLKMKTVRRRTQKFQFSISLTEEVKWWRNDYPEVKDLGSMVTTARNFLKKTQGEVTIMLTQPRVGGEVSRSRRRMRDPRPYEDFIKIRNLLVQAFLGYQDEDLLFDFETIRNNPQASKSLGVEMSLIVTVSKT